MRVPGVLVLMAVLAVSLAPARAAAADPAAGEIEAFQGELLATMKAGPSLGPEGRFKRLTPVVERAFDLPVMTRFAVGPDWSRMSEADHRALIAAFTRLSAASYAKNFNRWSGEKLTVDPNVVTRGTDKIVRAQIVPASGAPTDLMYRMRQDAGAWKIVDVYYGAISQLTTRRSDFAASLAAGGAPGLEKHLDALVDKLLK
jgi:phospholipid transport system substrate-binding protein